MVFIIAELGTNHMGDVKVAKKLIDVAVSAGCNAIKLQKRSVKKIFTENQFNQLHLFLKRTT